jgi:HPt (histidine-containing phosphotransfer) domain-containing protein
MDTAAVLDCTVIDELVALDPDGTSGLLCRLTKKYDGRCQQDLEILEQFVVEGHSENVRCTAHSLKSSSATLGAMRMVSLCQNLEDLAGQQQLSSAPEILEDIRIESRRVVDTLLNKGNGAA